MNVPYARMLRLAPSAFVGREYSQANHDERADLELPQALHQGPSLILPPDAPDQAEEENAEGRAPRRVPLLLNELAQPFGRVPEECPAAAAHRGAAG